MKNNFFWIVFVFVLCFLNQALASNTKLTTVKLSHGTQSLRIEFAFTQSPKSFKVFLLPNPNRLIVDLPQTKLTHRLPKISNKQSLVVGLRNGHPQPNLLRIVFDLKKSIKFSSFSKGKKIQIDLFTNRSHNMIRNVEQNISKPFIIVIDPGHGGKDPGAIGQYGIKEKHVALAISKRLANIINNQPNMRAVLTRTGDYFVPLRQRLQLARKGKADLFVAIHADSYFNSRAQGSSIYALSQRGATSEAARWLAKRENHAELDALDFGELEDKSYVLRSVLIDLAQTATVTDSLRLGNSILDALHRVTRLRYPRVEQAPFVVLKSPDIPSILVETGFLSNPVEEKKLTHAEYQTKLAQAVFNGIQAYMKNYAVAKL